MLEKSGAIKGCDCGACENYRKQEEITVASSNWLDSVSVARGIDDEPEFPDEMPDSMWQLLKELVEGNDREGMTEAFRDAVRLTKKGIKERIGI